MSVSATSVAPVFDKTPTAQVSEVRAKDSVADQDDNSVSAAAPPPSKPPEGQGRFVDRSV